MRLSGGNPGVDLEHFIIKITLPVNANVPYRTMLASSASHNSSPFRSFLDCPPHLSRRSSTTITMDTSQSKEEEEENFDLVIEGTGLPESILAAAASWIGKKVLHIDKNTYYGAEWAALSIDQLDTWVEQYAAEGILYSTYSDSRYSPLSLCATYSSPDCEFKSSVSSPGFPCLFD